MPTNSICTTQSAFLADLDEEGEFDGVLDGTLDGAFVGFSDGTSEGAFDGSDVGVAVGGDVGAGVDFLLFSFFRYREKGINNSVL